MDMLKQFFKSISKTLFQCLNNPYSSSIWIGFTIVGGLLGVIINIIQRCVFQHYSIATSLVLDSQSGFFYTFALVLSTSSLSPIFIKIIGDKEINFKKIKIGFVVTCIFTMLFSSVFYANHMSVVIPLDIETIKSSPKVVDGWQLFFFILSFCIALFSLGISYLDDDPEKYDCINDIKDYGKEEQKVLDNLSIGQSDKISTPDQCQL